MYIHDCEFKDKLTTVGDHIDIQTTNFKMWVERRPPYCDRGNYLWYCDNNLSNRMNLIDDQDGFPRYYFDYDAMITEMVLFLKKRNEEVLGVESHRIDKNSFGVKIIEEL